MTERPIGGKVRLYNVRVDGCRDDLAFWSDQRLRRGDHVIVRGGLLEGDHGRVAGRRRRFPRCGYAYRVSKGRPLPSPAQAMAEDFDRWCEERGVEPGASDLPDRFAEFLSERLGREVTGRPAP